jgi:hypothetical protein
MPNGKKKYKKKVKNSTVDAEQFDASLPPEQWPEGVEENEDSATGYGYGSLEITTTSETYTELGEDGKEVEKTVNTENREGFEVMDRDFMITNEAGKVSRMDEAGFLNKYDLA